MRKSVINFRTLTQSIALTPPQEDNHSINKSCKYCTFLCHSFSAETPLIKWYDEKILLLYKHENSASACRFKWYLSWVKPRSGIRVMNNWNKILNVSQCFPTPVHNQILDIIFRMYYTAKVAVVVVAIYSQLRGKTPGGSWIPAMVVAMPHTGKLLAILPPVLSLPPQYLVKQKKKKVINWLVLNSFRWPGVIYFYC